MQQFDACYVLPSLFVIMLALQYNTSTLAIGNIMHLLHCHGQGLKYAQNFKGHLGRRIKKIKGPQFFFSGSYLVFLISFTHQVLK